MAAQSFDMQSALSGGCIQQTPVSSSGQSQSPQSSATSTVQQQQAKQNALAGKAQQTQVSSSPQPSQQQQQTPNGGSQTTSTGVSSPSTATSSQQSSVVVVAGTQSHQPQTSRSPTSATHSQQASVVQQASANAPQFITVGEDFVAVSDQDSPSQSLQPAHHAYVHYVDSTADPSSLYSTTNGQMSGYSVYSVSDSATMYTPASTTYYNTGSGTAVSYSQIEQQVQWLIDNYETAEGVSLPRSTLYNHYLRHCTEHKLEPVNAASFGKLIRSVFLGLRTRRLGTRGNSKYHYYGIRVKPNSPLIAVLEESGSPLLRSASSNKSRYKSSPPTKAELTDSNSSTGGSVGGGGPSGDNASGGGNTTSSSSSIHHHQSGGGSSSSGVGQHQHQQYLGDASSAIPDCLDTTEFEGSLLPDGITDDDLETFKALYREHCESFLEAVVSMEFSVVESLWQSFWRTNGGHTQSELEKILSKSKLFCLCKCEAVLAFVRKADYQFYQNLVEILIPDVLKPIPSSLTQAIRNFAKSLEGWLTSAMVGCPQEVAKVKVSAVSAFAQTLRRYTSLNHLAQAARAVLQNASQISQMLADLNRVDFHNVQEQASWVCQCEEGMVQHLEQDFKLTLQQQNSLEQWATWLEGVVSLVLHPHEGKPDFPKAARQFLLKWSFYSSMVIRDLTLRSAASFGSFHLIRLLYDEYMFYLIEHRVAKATGETPIAVMGEAWPPIVQFIGMGNRLYCGTSSKDLLGASGNNRLAAALQAPPSAAAHAHTRLLVENGDCSSAVGLLGGSTTVTSYTLANGGLKDSSTAALSSLQQGLIGQPPVCIVTSSDIVHSSSPPTDSGLGNGGPGPSKKMKVVA